MQACVLGLADHAHTPAAELLDNTVVGDGLADHWKMGGSRVDSSYGGGIRQSTNTDVGNRTPSTWPWNGVGQLPNSHCDLEQDGITPG